jgi:GntR family transcriptional regulator/MocR family aminotransferase
MSLPRRVALLAWARRSDAWIIEDDYLSELQLKGRAAPALASLDDGVGFCTSAVSAKRSAWRCVWASWSCRRNRVVGSVLAPAPGAAAQRAAAEFLREGHYLRHLRRMKLLYAAQREALLRCLGEMASDAIKVQATAGLAVVLLLPEFASDVDIALRALQFGLAPAPLSPWCVHKVTSERTDPKQLQTSPIIIGAFVPIRATKEFLSG